MAKLTDDINNRPPMSLSLALGVATQFAHTLSDPNLKVLLLSDRDAISMLMGYFAYMLEEKQPVDIMFKRAYTLLIDHLEAELESTEPKQPKQ